MATVLVKRGTLKRGDIVVAGASWGRVRALLNERDEQVAEAEPSTPVEVLGLDGAAGSRRSPSRWWRTKPAPASSPSTASG